MSAVSWRSEYYNACDTAERVSHAIKQWPKELSQPIIRKLRTPWEQREFRAPLAASGLQPYREVLAWVESIRRELSSLKLEMVSGDAELCEMAERCARMCVDYPDAAEFITQRVGLEVPNGRHMTDTGKLLRMQCVRWWRRRMRAHFGQAVENAMRARGYVRKGRAAYCTDWALRRRTSQRQRTQTMLQAAVATNELGEQMSLFDAVQASVSNPVNRRNELMTRIRGFEELATEAGHVALFGTLTAPSCYHAQHSGGGENDLFKAAGKPSVRAAQSWLCRMWARARAKLQRLGFRIYGFRIAEPHHDGTPHWHALFFMQPSHVQAVTKVVASIWLSEHADEKGAAEYRTQFKKIDPALGDAAGYVAKYVAKNIDGFNVGQDYEAGGEATTTAHRVDAWASTHRIRQFQQIGGAPVGVWRECRRVNANGEDMAPIQDAVRFADDGDWCGFSKASTGVTLWKEQIGECNAYHEVAQPKVIGLSALESKLTVVQRPSFKRWSMRRAFSIVPTKHVVASVRTRLHEWRVQWKASDQKASYESRQGAAVAQATGMEHAKRPGPVPPLGPVSITVRTSTYRAVDGDTGTNIDHEKGQEAVKARGRDRIPGSIPGDRTSLSSHWPANRPNDGKLIYQHAGKWHVRNAISISEAMKPRAGPVLFTFERYPFCPVRFSS